MALLSSILGFSLFGLGARIGQLGIQKRNLLDSAHPITVTTSSGILTFVIACVPMCIYNRSRWAYRFYARLWLHWVLGPSVGRACIRAHRGKACGDCRAAQAENRTSRGGVSCCVGSDLVESLISLFTFVDSPVSWRLFFRLMLNHVRCRREGLLSPASLENTHIRSPRCVIVLL